MRAPEPRGLAAKRSWSDAGPPRSMNSAFVIRRRWIKDPESQGGCSRERGHPARTLRRVPFPSVLARQNRRPKPRSTSPETGCIATCDALRPPRPRNERRIVMTETGTGGCMSGAVRWGARGVPLTYPTATVAVAAGTMGRRWGRSPATEPIRRASVPRHAGSPMQSIGPGTG